MTLINGVHPSLAKRKVHYWIEGGPHAVCGQPDGPLLRCSRRPFKITCQRCQYWYQANQAGQALPRTYPVGPLRA